MILVSMSPKAVPIFGVQAGLSVRPYCSFSFTVSAAAPACSLAALAARLLRGGMWKP
jgi:hypothetical protein